MAGRTRRLVSLLIVAGALAGSLGATCGSEIREQQDPADERDPGEAAVDEMMDDAVRDSER